MRNFFRNEKIRVAIASKIRPMQTVPLSAQISFQETERSGARSASSGKTTPSSSVSNTSSPKVLSNYNNTITGEESSNMRFREPSSSSVPQGQHV